MSTEIQGKIIDNINVEISYKIIELFSAGLYSSPNKAFEELICNSYDAFANTVSVYVSPDLNNENSYIMVCDDGEGLTQDEFKNLWKILHRPKIYYTKSRFICKFNFLLRSFFNANY